MIFTQKNSEHWSATHSMRVFYYVLMTEMRVQITIILSETWVSVAPKMDMSNKKNTIISIWHFHKHTELE